MSLPALLMLLCALVAGCASLPANTDHPVTTAFASPEQTPLGRLVLARRAQAGTRGDSAFSLLDNEDAAFTSRLALIGSAQRTLDLQYYAIHADGSTQALLTALRDAAARGVRVRILLDDFNTAGADAQVLRLGFENNVALRLFNPLPGSRSSLFGRVFASLGDMQRIQKRMHNKLLIADSAMGVAGGRNLGDAYFGRADAGNFVDLDVLAAGRIVRDMAASFDTYWNSALAYPVQTLLSRQDIEDLRIPPPGTAPAAPGEAAPPAPPRPLPVLALAGGPVLPDVTATLAAPGGQRQPMDLARAPLTWAPALLLADRPGKIGPDDDEADAGDTVVDGLLQLMGQAREDVLVISPYFVPGTRMMQQLAAIRARGVRIRVLTNSLASNDAPAAHAGYARYRRALLAMGVELHELRTTQGGSIGGLGSTRGSRLGGQGAGSGTASRASLHSKAVFIDGRLAVIGSMNLDLRSQRQNSEVALVIRSAVLTREATRLVEATLAQGAYRLEWVDGHLLWHAPPGAAFQDATSEPDASARLKLLVNLLGPFAPDEML